MTIESFVRTWEQNEELGLNDMKVENYEADAEPSKDAQPVSASEAKEEKPVESS